MRLLLAVDSITTTELILKTIESRSWPAGTEARILSAVEDAEVPHEVWREAGYGVGAVQQEMKRRGEQIAALSGSPSANRYSNSRRSHERRSRILDFLCCAGMASRSDSYSRPQSKRFEKSLAWKCGKVRFAIRVVFC
jgi:hypothetical protein